MLSSPQFPAILAQLRHQFDHVIIDTPPVLELADAGIVGAQSDDVLLVVRMNRTPRHMVDEAINLLNGYQAPVTGAVLTDMHFTASGGNYGYRYGYRYSSRYSYKSRHGYRTRRERMSA
jgi:tyrosine-protein kinase Etk/Wzc